MLKRRKHIYLCTNGMFIKKRLHEFRPTSRFFFNVHLDGLETTHDLAVERKYRQSGRPIYRANYERPETPGAT